MPTTYQTAPAWQPDREGSHPLVEFLTSLEYVLDQAVRIPGLAVPDQFRNQVSEAWTGEVKPAIEQLRAEILSGQHDEGFSRVGLSGLQLTMKLAIYGDAYKRTMALLDIVMQDYEASQETAGQSQVQPPAGVTAFFTGAARKMMRYLFKPANVILKSMGAVAPLAHMLEEFKGMVETGVDYIEFQAKGTLSE